MKEPCCYMNNPTNTMLTWEFKPDTNTRSLVKYYSTFAPSTGDHRSHCTSGCNCSGTPNACLLMNSYEHSISQYSLQRGRSHVPVISHLNTALPG